jgi:DNA-binding beta-propeller fold protein YncE
VQHGLAYAGRDDGSVAVFSTATNSVIAEISCLPSKKLVDLTVDAQGRKLYVAADDGTVVELDATSGKELRYATTPHFKQSNIETPTEVLMCACSIGLEG